MSQLISGFTQQSWIIGTDLLARAKNFKAALWFSFLLSVKVGSDKLWLAGIHRRGEKQRT